MLNIPSTPARVLIVGAGPTGLSLANILTRYGIPVRLIEKKSQLSRHTKATNIMQRTQELLSSIDLLEPLNDIGGQMSRMMIHAYGGNFGPRTMHLTESPFPNVILCGQHNFEAIAASGLNDLGVEIEFGSELTHLEHDDNGCVATIAQDGSTTKALFDYVIGCDGHAGVTRTFTSLNFSTTKTGVAIRQVDCELSWHRSGSMDQMWLFYFDHGFAVVVPLPGGVHRVLIISPTSMVAEREPTLEEIQTELRTISSDPTLQLSNPEWFSYTDLSMGIAPALIDRRVILAGDVGNPVLPNGGQGMNTGIADAFNLGWKLAAVMNGTAPATLLATYNEERHALRTALEKAQFASLKYTTLTTPKIVGAMFRAFAEPILNRGVERRVALAFSELMVNTRKSSLTTNTGSGPVRGGDRAFDAVVSHDRMTCTLFDLIYQGGWTLLGFTGRGRTIDTATTIDALRKIPAGIASYLVSTETLPEHSRREADSFGVLHDLDGEAHRNYATKKPTLFLIRPDGHIGVRVSPGQVQALIDYATTWGAGNGHTFTQGTPAQLDVVEQ